MSGASDAWRWQMWAEVYDAGDLEDAEDERPSGY